MTIKLPPMPEPDHKFVDLEGEAPDIHVWNQASLEAYAREAVRLNIAAERERCAKPVPDEWLVKVRRLVQGFEHVSGIARLWEPDYSSGSERALWARATEACADVARLLREVEGPNSNLSEPRKL